jgi:hypothetical protein
MKGNNILGYQCYTRDQSTYTALSGGCVISATGIKSANNVDKGIKHIVKDCEVQCSSSALCTSYQYTTTTKKCIIFNEPLRQIGFETADTKCYMKNGIAPKSSGGGVVVVDKSDGVTVPKVDVPDDKNDQNIKIGLFND